MSLRKNFVTRLMLASRGAFRIRCLPFRGRLRFALGQGQHGAATFGRTAKATVLFAQLFRLAPLNDEGVVEEEFFALGDVAQTVDVEPAAGFVFAGFAVRAAGMVDPARIVAALAAIHN